MAAVCLQQAFAELLRPRLAQWKWLPALFADELGVSREGTPRERLIQPSRAHQRHTQMVVNWVGTYEDVVRRLLRQWELERQWSR